MAKFVIQKRASAHEIWYTPSGFDRETKAGPLTSDSVNELRETLAAVADATTLDWWHHYRIITEDGKPVERYKVRPGTAKKTRARY